MESIDRRVPFRAALASPEFVRRSSVLTSPRATTARRRGLVAVVQACTLLVLALGACRAPVQISANEDLVPCPLAARADALLGELVRDCGSRDGRWRHDLGPGCARIWAVRFGLTAGLRRDRKDLLALARATADRQRADARSLVWSALFGSVDAEGPQAFGMPALLVSGMLDGDGAGYQLFRLAFDRSGDALDPKRLRPDQRAGLAVLQAELARAAPSESAEHLSAARSLAAEVDVPSLRAFALACIARRSALPQDLVAAREATEVALMPAHWEEGRLVFERPKEQVLSEELALVGALSELALAAGSDLDRVRAQALLAALFEGPLFDGRFLVHDAEVGGARSDRHCAGCNWNALYLVDRLWGDTWRIAAVPELPDRAHAPQEWSTQEHDLFVLRPKQRGTYGFARMGVTVEYEELPVDADRPLGGLKVEITWNEAPVPLFRGRGVVHLEPDGSARVDVARVDPLAGAWNPERARAVFVFGPAAKGGRSLRLLEERLVE